MGLFSKDLYRFFTIGFVAGAALVVATMGGDGLGSMIADEAVPAAHAQTAE